MGFSGISISSLLLIFAILLLLFGTRRLRTMGRDLGEALGGFREGLKEANRSEDDSGGKGDV